MTKPKQNTLDLDGGGIIRVEKRERWLTIENATVRDKRLTFGARGLHHFILSFPNKWELKVRHLIKHSPAGRDAVYSMLRELEKYRYLIRRRVQGHKGRIVWLSTIYETPQGDPLTDDAVRQLHGGRPKRKKGDKHSLPFTDKPYLDGPDTGEPEAAQPDTARPDTGLPDTDEAEANYEVVPSDESPNDESPIREITSRGERVSASSSEEEEDASGQGGDDAEAVVLNFYTYATGNGVRNSDVSCYRERLASLDVLVVKGGIAQSVYRCFEAESPVRINSLAYCMGAIEEMRALAERNYLRRMITAIDQDFTGDPMEFRFAEKGVTARTIRAAYQERAGMLLKGDS